MERSRITSLYLILVISCALHLLDNAASLPLPDESSLLPNDETEDEAHEAAEPILFNDPAIEDESLLGEDESLNERVQDTQQIALSDQQQTVVRILPSVDAVIENEIWQYRYPPFFNDVVSSDDDFETGDSGGLGSARSSIRLNRDALPSYVIGILDPSELVEGLFQPFRRDAAEDGDGNRNGKNLERPTIPAGVPKVILESDRWVWSKSSDSN